MTMIVDAHQHFWDLNALEYKWIPKDHPVLSRNYMPRDLAPLISREGVHRTVLVQANHSNEENRWALKLTKDFPFIAGIVGTADIGDANIEATLAEFADHPRFVGVRFNVGTDSTSDGRVRPELARGLAALDKLDLSCDLLVPGGMLGQVPAIAAAFPNVRFIVDHLGCPPIKSGEIDAWSAQLEAVSERSNVAVKLSGLITLADRERWRPADIKPYVHAAVELFGFERLMFGSDWPVCLMSGTYDRVVANLRDCLGVLTDSEHDQVWGGTATRVYRLVR